MFLSITRNSDTNYSRITSGEISAEAFAELPFFPLEKMDELRPFCGDLDPNVSCEESSFFSCLGSASNELLVIMVIDMYREFEKSEQYRKWREYERSGEEMSVHTKPSCLSIRTKTVENYHPRVLRQIVDISWLKTLLKCLSKLPVSMSVVNASVERTGFPIEYANSTFFETTKFDKVFSREFSSHHPLMCCALQNDVLGRGLVRTLISDKSSEDAILAINDCLKYGEPLRTVVECKHESFTAVDGPTKRCLLFIKPIFDFSSKYRYCIVIHRELPSTHSELFPYELKVISDLVEVIPSVLSIEKVDEDLSDLYVRRSLSTSKSNSHSRFE
jgi:hypothetical protein